MNNLYLKNIVTLKLDKEACVKCGMCINVCPHEVFELKNSKLEMINRDRCMECGACQINCPVGAISVKAGVGCAYAMIKGALTGTEPSCGCGDGDSGCC
ncbi:MAG: mercury methylation ferredoxin HgcB [Proteobacteria bacterium]|nr:mercury methylation ferredoxin HgcB [Pseudomonadota bacterium]